MVLDDGESGVAGRDCKTIGDGRGSWLGRSWIICAGVTMVRFSAASVARVCASCVSRSCWRMSAAARSCLVAASSDSSWERPPCNYALLAVLPHQFAQGVYQFRLHIVEPLVVRPHIDRRIGSAIILLASANAIAGRKRRSHGCPRYPGGEIAVRRRYRARNTRPRFSFVVPVHSASQKISRQRSQPRHGWRQSRARLGAGATSASSIVAMAVASDLRETPPAEIRPCQATNSSAHDSPHAVVTLLLPAIEHSSTARVVSVFPT